MTIQNFDYQKTDDAHNYNYEELKKILIQIQKEVEKLDARINALEAK